MSHCQVSLPGMGMYLSSQPGLFPAFSGVLHNDCTGSQTLGIQYVLVLGKHFP